MELALTSLVRRDGLEELVGVLRPPATGSAEAPQGASPLGELPPAEPVADDPSCGCGPDDGAPAPASARPEGGWDHASYLATRSRFEVVYPDGSAREVYMPDHVCPLCLNEQDNAIDTCDRVCGACDFRW